VTKIYEALERVQKETRNSRKEQDTSLPHQRVSPSSPPLSGLFMQDEMALLFQNLNPLLSNSLKKIVQFIGSREGEGTSTVIREFAIVSATKFGKLVLLLDADQDKPTHHFFFNLKKTEGSPKSEYGWNDVALSEEPVDKALYQIPGTSLFISPVSQNSLSIQRIFNSHEIDAFLERLKQKFDLILIDSPPVTISSDGLAISKKVDGVVLVLEAENTRWPIVESVKSLIERNGGNLLGMVFNKRRYYIPDSIYRRL